MCLVTLLTIDHGEGPEVLVRPQLHGGTKRHTQGHGFDFPLHDVDVTGIQEENIPGERDKEEKEITNQSDDGL